MVIECVEDYLIFEEGEELSAYQDSKGFWTIGVGHMIDKRKGGQIPHELSRALLDYDVGVHEQYLRYFTWYGSLSVVRKGVLISMLHQLGSLQAWPDFIAAMNAGDWKAAAAAMLNSDVAKYEAPKRWARAAQMMETDQWPVVTEST
jgi:lysozyme